MAVSTTQRKRTVHDPLAGSKKVRNKVDKPQPWWSALMKDEATDRGKKMEYVLAATEQLIGSIAASVYKNNKHDGTTMEDLISAGREGVMTYLDKYDGSTVPNTYFKGTIIDFCCREIHASNGSTKHESKICRQYRETEEKLIAEGKIPTLDSVARTMGVSKDTLFSNLNKEAARNSTISIYDEETGQIMAEAEAAPSSLSKNPEQIVLEEEHSSVLARALGSLTEMDRELIQLYVLEQKSFGEVSRILKEKYGKTRISKKDTVGKGFSVNQISRSLKMITEYLAQGEISEYTGRRLLDIKPQTQFDDGSDEEVLDVAI